MLNRKTELSSKATCYSFILSPLDNIPRQFCSLSSWLPWQPGSSVWSREAVNLDVLHPSLSPQANHMPKVKKNPHSKIVSIFLKLSNILEARACAA